MATKKRTTKKRGNEKAQRALDAHLAKTQAVAADEVKVRVASIGKAIKEAIGEMQLPRTHQLKSWPEHFAMAAAGLKPFEIRRNDRDFKVGDRLNLKEWIPLGADRGKFTDRELLLDVLTVTEPIGILPGFVAMTVAATPKAAA
jgi:hypothetical protein